MPQAPQTIRQRNRAKEPRPPKRETDASRFRNTQAWRRTRAYAMQLMPLCVLCKQAGRLEPTRQMHHVLAVDDRPDLALDVANLAGLCVPCHGRITGMERAGKDTARLFEGLTPDGGIEDVY